MAEGLFVWCGLGRIAERTLFACYGLWRMIGRTLFAWCGLAKMAKSARLFAMAYGEWLKRHYICLVWLSENSLIRLSEKSLIGHLFTYYGLGTMAAWPTKMAEKTLFAWCGLAEMAKRTVCLAWLRDKSLIEHLLTFYGLGRMAGWLGWTESSYRSAESRAAGWASKEFSCLLKEVCCVVLPVLLLLVWVVSSLIWQQWLREGWLAGWLVVWLGLGEAGWLAGWLYGWAWGKLAGWLVGWDSKRLGGFMAGCMTDCMAG